MERKEAIEVIKKNYPHCAESGTQFETALRTLIPELKESEDERIRKFIIEQLLKIRKTVVYNSNLDRELANAIAWLEKQAPKPKWTEEDSSMQLMLMRDIEQVSFISKEGKDERIMWLNKLDDRFHQNTNDIQKPKWTEEDEKRLQSIINTLECDIKQFTNTTDIVETQDNILWLKSLNSPKPEWTEKDEKTFNNLLTSLIRISYNTSTNSTTPNYMFFEEIEWLKELKQRMEGK